MTTEPQQRDYSLTGPESIRAAERGLANADWFLPFVDPARMRELTRRTNGRATVDAILWFGLIIGTGVVAYRSIGSWWAIPAFAVYGALYGGSSDARWHETGHSTAFSSPLANDVVYYFASFALLREPTLWRWSHVRHHSDTIIVGRDPEIVFPRPPSFARLFPNFLNILGGTAMLKRTVVHALGKVDADAADFIPASEHHKLIREARVIVAIHLAVIVWSIAIGSIVPLLFVTLASFYGVWLVLFFGLTQHAGLREDVLDHRLNSRTVYMNPVFRFLYLNMNYHVEHHMFPSVPYRNLPALHAEVKSQLAPPRPNTWAAYRELIFALRQQRKDPTFELPVAELPEPTGPARRANAMTAQGVEAWGVEMVRSAGGVDLGAVADLAVGDLRRVDLDGRTFLLCRPEQSMISLSDGLCTHGNAHLADGVLDGCFIECPKHNGRFDLRTGEPARRPVQVSLRRYSVEIVDGRMIGSITLPAADGDAMIPTTTT